MPRTTTYGVARARDILSDLITDATIAAEHAALAGEEPTAYDALETDLRAALARLAALRTHAHEWDGRGYCTVCGTDGRA